VPARRLLIGFAAAAAAAAGVAAGFLSGRGEGPLEIGGYVLERPRALPDLELVDEQAAPFRSAAFAGHWSFLYFGYTYCPDVCPLTLVELASVHRQLAAELPEERVAYYFVSVDPRRDTPARLREWVAYFDAEFHALTGSPSTLAALAQATETLFEVPENPSTDNYLVSHSSNLVLLDPSGKLHAVLTPPHAAARLVADFTKVARRYASSR
jgi:protein SCO1/2